MSAETKIQWTEHTWNPIAGCSVVSPGCTNCYAMRRVAPRLAANPATPQYHGTVQPSKAGHIWTGKIGVASDAKFLEPLRIKAPAMWFVNSTSDLFHENVPDEVIDRVFAVMALTPQHTYQVLTKRSKRMREYLSDDASRLRVLQDGVDRELAAAGISWNGDWNDRHSQAIAGATQWPLPNVWLGVSVEDQTRADERIPDLLATPAAIRFISAEPLLGPVDLTNLDHLGTLRAQGIHGISAIWKNNHVGRECLDWVIVGGESGSGARPMHPDWARSIRDQCKAAGVPFFFKQWGEWEIALDRSRDDPDWRADYTNAYGDHGKTRWLNLEGGRGFHGVSFHVMRQVGSKRAGRLLDGIEHNAMPELPR
ncbi:MAG: phage Gp37/Gp68 family protein [Hoeflea sp.]|nr:phage Gp37/Gp68 family protein [Hoeflea sp.]